MHPYRIIQSLELIFILNTETKQRPRLIIQALVTLLGESSAEFLTESIQPLLLDST